MNRQDIARYIDEQTKALTMTGVTIGEIASKSGIRREMLYQIRKNLKPASWEHGLGLGVAYPKFYNPKVIVHEFYEKLDGFGLEVKTKETLGSNRKPMKTLND